MLKSIDHFALIIAISERQACHTARMQQIQYYFLLCNYSSHAKKYSTYNFTVMKWGTNFDEWLFVFDVLVYGCVPIVYCRWPSKVADWRVRSLLARFKIWDNDQGQKAVHFCNKLLFISSGFDNTSREIFTSKIYGSPFFEIQVIRKNWVAKILLPQSHQY